MSLHDDSEDIKPDVISIKPEPLREAYFEETYILPENEIKHELILSEGIPIKIKHERVEDSDDTAQQFDVNPEISMSIGVKNKYCVCPTVGCGAQFKSQFLLKKHIISDCYALKRLFTCASDNCKYEITQESNANNQHYLCLELGCDGKFKDLSLLKSHILACHGSSSVYNTTKQELDEHDEINYDCNKEEHKCGRCKKVFASAASLIIHKRQSFKRTCKCGQLFCVNVEYCKHKRHNCEVYKSVRKKQICMSAGKLMKCPYSQNCNKEYELIQSLRAHIKSQHKKYHKQHKIIVVNTE